MVSKIAMGVVSFLFLVTLYAGYSGWGLPTTVAAEAKRREIANRRSARIGIYTSGGLRYGK